MRETVLENGEKGQECIYSPHSIGATTATLLLDSSVAIESVQELLDHKHITATQIYDKRRRSVRDDHSLRGLRTGRVVTIKRSSGHIVIELAAQVGSSRD